MASAPSPLFGKLSLDADLYIYIVLMRNICERNFQGNADLYIYDILTPDICESKPSMDMGPLRDAQIDAKLYIYVVSLPAICQRKIRATPTYTEVPRQ